MLHIVHLEEYPTGDNCGSKMNFLWKHKSPVSLEWIMSYTLCPSWSLVTSQLVVVLFSQQLYYGQQNSKTSKRSSRSELRSPITSFFINARIANSTEIAVKVKPYWPTDWLKMEFLQSVTWQCKTLTSSSAAQTTTKWAFFGSRLRRRDK